MRLSGLVDSLFEMPVITVKNYKNEFGITYPTARSDLNKLAALGIIDPLDGGSITYFCPAIYNVTYEDIEP